MLPRPRLDTLMPCLGFASASRLLPRPCLDHDGIGSVLYLLPSPVAQPGFYAGVLKLERGPGFLTRKIVETVSTLKKWDNLGFTLHTLKAVKISADKGF